MEDYQKKDFAKILKSGSLEGRRWMRRTDSTCVRIYDRNLEAIPCTVELYDKYAKVVDYSDPPMDAAKAREVKDIISRMVYIESDKIVFQKREKREALQQHTLASSETLPLTVRENGLEFKVDLVSHIDTGLFLDQTYTRDLVRSLASGLRVLNLFSYTGSFSVYAASGGAESVTSVDMSNTYTSIARENLRANGFASKLKYPCLAMDAASFLLEALEKKESYDLIIFDPPAFSNSHKMNRPFDIKKDCLAWCAALNGLLSENGVLILSVNLSSFVLEKGKLKQGFKIKEITNDVRAFGFVGGKPGQARVWLMEKTGRLPLAKSKIMREVKDEDLDGLFLSMEEDRKDEEKNREKRGDERNARDDYRRDGDRYERNSGGRKSAGNRADGERERRGYARRDSERRGEREYSRRDSERRGERDYSRRDDDRSYKDGSRRSYSREGRNYSDERRDGYRGEGNYRDRRNGYRGENGDGYRDGYRDGGRSYSREGRNYSDERRDGYRGEGSYRDRRDSYRSEESYGGHRSGYRDERRSYYREEERDIYGDRESRNYNKDKRNDYRSDMRSRSAVKPDYVRREKRSAVKPYGYDDIEKSRNRGEEE